MNKSNAKSFLEINLGIAAEKIIDMTKEERERQERLLAYPIPQIYQNKPKRVLD